MTLRVEAAQIGGAGLVDRLLAGDPEVVALYGGHPLRVESFRAKWAEVSGRFDRAARERAADALRPSSDAARARLARFVDEGGAMVTTGQQAGLFTGPMYTVSKALTAVRLAERLEELLGIIVIPVFWVASEDHDFAEVSHAWAVDGSGALRRPTIRATSGIPVPMSEMRLGDDVGRILDEFIEAIVGDGDSAADLRRDLAAYSPGETVSGAFGRTMASLLSPFDVCIADAADPALKAASAWVLAGEVERSAEHERRVGERTSRITALGLTPPVAVLPDTTHLFLHGTAGRERINREGERLVAEGAGERHTAASLSAAVRADPVRFSPNVLLRPVVESAVFPTLAYVGGPAETGYFAQIGPLFEAFEIRPPIAFPRFGVRIVPGEVAALQDELALPDEVLTRPEHELLERVARARIPAEVTDALSALRRGTAEGFAGLLDAAVAIEPTLAGALGARRNRVLLEIAAAERRIIRQLKRSDLATGRGVRTVRNHLRPQGVPQERVLTVLQYLARDRDLLQRIMQQIRIELTDG